MPAEQWSIMPPETIAIPLYGGLGSGSLVTAASQWTALATQFEAVKNSFTEIATTVLAGWTGPAASMLDSAAQAYRPKFDMMATYAGTVAGQLGTVAGLFETAKAAAASPEEIAANRELLLDLLVANVAAFGTLTPQILETEALYMGMWFQTSAAMIAYETGCEASALSVGPQLGGIATAVQVPVSAAELGAGVVDEEFFDAVDMADDVLDGVTVAGLDAASLGTQAATQGLVGTAAPGAQGLVGTAAPGVEGLAGAAAPAAAAGVESLGSSAASTLASYGETAVSTGGSMTGNLAPAVMSMAQTGMGSSTTGWSATQRG